MNLMGSEPEGEIRVGTKRKTRDLAMRRGVCDAPTRAPRRRILPTKHGHAALLRYAGVTREYQSDSSSKRPISCLALGPRAGPSTSEIKSRD